MTLEDAVTYYSEIAKECRQNARIESNDYMDMRDATYEAEQLADWLNELIFLRERIDGLISRQTATDDSISRQAAIDAIRSYYDEFDTSDKSIEERIKDLPSAQPKPKWIPCSERLPEYEQEVLVTRHFLSDNQLKKNAITESFYVEVASLIDDEWTSYSDEYKIKRHLHKVIAWMPLPKPWEGEKECLETK